MEVEGGCFSQGELTERTPECSPLEFSRIAPGRTSSGPRRTSAPRSRQTAQFHSQLCPSSCYAAQTPSKSQFCPRPGQANGSEPPLAPPAGPHPALEPPLACACQPHRPGRGALRRTSHASKQQTQTETPAWIDPGIFRHGNGGCLETAKEEVLIICTRTSQGALKPQWAPAFGERSSCLGPEGERLGGGVSDLGSSIICLVVLDKRGWHKGGGLVEDRLGASLLALGIWSRPFISVPAAASRDRGTPKRACSGGAGKWAFQERPCQAQALELCSREAEFLHGGGEKTTPQDSSACRQPFGICL